jgi:hypothetical protein
MSLETLDRTLWSYAETLAHVQKATVERRMSEAAGQPEPVPSVYPWDRPRDPVEIWKAQAAEQLLIALRDGDLIAQGRFSEERKHRWDGIASDTGFGLHSGYHTSIRPEQWREGKYLNGKLTAMFWEFIDIRMPRFMVKAVWPDFAPTVQPRPPEGPTPYTTPYLELMQAAIARFQITAESQEKKDCLVDWFLAQEVEGEPVSRNLADAMATLVRLPSAQRGGAKRMTGPDLRQTG